MVYASTGSTPEGGSSKLSGTAHIWTRPRISSVWAAAAIAIPAAVVTVFPFLSIDLAYQIRLGDLMRKSGSLIRTDVLTFTAAGLPWIDQQWGAQILTSWAFEYGWFGLAVLRLALVTGILIFVYLSCSAASKRLAAYLTIGSAMLLLGGFQLRPQTFGMLCFSALFWLIAGRHIYPRRLWWALPIIVAWANLHGSFFLALVVILGTLMEDTAARRPTRRLFYVTLSSLVVTLANPFGWRLWSYVQTITTNSLIRTSVEEWTPPTIHAYSGALFFLSAIAIAIFLARRPTRAPWPQLAWLAGFFALGLTATRSVFWWALAAPVLIAGLLAHSGKERPNPRNRANLAIVCIIMGILFSSLSRWYPYTSSNSLPPRQLVLNAPAALTQQLRQEVHSGERIFAPQIWGSWFELMLPSNPVAVDSRIEIFPPEVWSSYLAVSQGRYGWQSILDCWDIKVAVLNPGQQKLLIPRMKSDQRWRLVYQDDDGIIFRRR